MKNSFWKNLAVMLVTIIIVMPFAYSGAEAIEFETVEKDKETQDANTNSGLSVAKCFEKGSLEYVLFLNTFIFSDGITEGIVQPWKDVLVRNQCHGMDISGLLNQQDKVSKYIRDSFLTCKTENLPAYKKAFNEINVEIYYVRHVVDAGVVISLPYDLLSLKVSTLKAIDGNLENSEFYYPRDKLYADMKQKYATDGYFDDDAFNLLFGKIENKYIDKKEQYVLCDSGSFDQVGEKFQEFIDSFSEMGEDFEKDIGGAAEGILEAVGEEGGFPIDSFNAKSFGDFLGSYVKTNVNKQAPMAGLSELQEYSQEYVDMLENAAKTVAYMAKEATTKQNDGYNLDFGEEGEEKAPSPSELPSSVEDLLKKYQFESNRFDTEAMRSKMAAIIEANYGNVGDQVISAYVSELNALNVTITAAYPKINVIKECSKKMNEKQCVQ